MDKKIILGTVQMGLDYGINNAVGKISFDDSCKILKRAFELGIDTLDTAEAYGSAHTVIGNFHKLNPDIKFKVITKIPDRAFSSAEIKNKIERYITELNVPFLEVVMFHSFDSYQQNKKFVEVLLSLKNQGKIKKIGVSVYTNFQIESLLTDDDESVIQMPFNLLDNLSVRGDLLKKMKLYNKEVHTRSAFLQGLFFKKEYDDNVSKQLVNELNTLKNIAKDEGITLSNLALSYCMAQNDIDKVLIGVDSVNQLLENLKAYTYKISSSTIDKINAVKVNNLDLLNPSLWK